MPLSQLIVIFIFSQLILLSIYYQIREKKSFRMNNWLAKFGIPLPFVFLVMIVSILGVGLLGVNLIYFKSVLGLIIIASGFLVLAPSLDDYLAYLELKKIEANREERLSSFDERE